MLYPEHPEHLVERTREALDKARAAYVRASAANAGLTPRPATALALARYTRAAGRFTVALAEAGRDPRRVEAYHDFGAGALIGKAGVSAARAAKAQAALAVFVQGAAA